MEGGNAVAGIVVVVTIKNNNINRHSRFSPQGDFFIGIR